VKLGQKGPFGGEGVRGEKARFWGERKVQNFYRSARGGYTKGGSAGLEKSRRGRKEIMALLSTGGQKNKGTTRSVKVTVKTRRDSLSKGGSEVVATFHKAQ